MKRKGCRSDFNQDRDRELRRAFFSQGVYSTSDEVMRKTVKTPASRFWVDPERARDVLSRMEKDPQALSGMKPERRRMYKELFSRYIGHRRKYPLRPKIDCVSMAVYSIAPEFFISPNTARRMIYQSSC